MRRVEACSRKISTCNIRSNTSHTNYKTTSLFRRAPFSDPNCFAGWRQTPIIIAQQPSRYDVMTVRAATLVTDATRDVGGEESPFIAAAILFRNLDESINLGLRPVAINLVFTWSCVSVKVRIRILTQHTFRVIARLFTLGRFTVLTTSSIRFPSVVCRSRDAASHPHRLLHPPAKRTRHHRTGRQLIHRAVLIARQVTRTHIVFDFIMVSDDGVIDELFAADSRALSRRLYRNRLFQLSFPLLRRRRAFRRGARAVKLNLRFIHLERR